jgi:hypothetical protein
MANTVNAFGLRPVRKLDGSTLNFQTQKVFIPASDSNIIGIGDLVTYTTFNTTNNILNLPTVTLYAKGNSQVAGVVVAIDFLTGLSVPQENTTYRLASTAMYLEIIVDELTVFEIMSTGTVAGTNLLGNFDIATGTSTSTNTGLSGMELDTSTVATTATLPMRALSFSPQVNNLQISTNSIFQVMLNTLATRSSTGLTL